MFGTCRGFLTHVSTRVCVGLPADAVMLLALVQGWRTRGGTQFGLAEGVHGMFAVHGVPVRVPNTIPCIVTPTRLPLGATLPCVVALDDRLERTNPQPPRGRGRGVLTALRLGSLSGLPAWPAM